MKKLKFMKYIKKFESNYDINKIIDDIMKDSFEQTRYGTIKDFVKNVTMNLQIYKQQNPQHSFEIDEQIEEIEELYKDYIN